MRVHNKYYHLQRTKIPIVIFSRERSSTGSNDCFVVDVVVVVLVVLVLVLVGIFIL
jgi:hypothetical protein